MQKGVNMINHIGEEKYSKYGTLSKIIEQKSNYIVIEFQDEYKTNLRTSYVNWKNNEFKNPYDKSVLNVACIGKVKGTENGKVKKSYKTWYSMINRCYNKDFHNIEKTYKDCSVCNEWLCYENFEKWYNENYYEIDGENMHLDKDIIIKGNKVYSPETCCFVPPRINKLFIKNDKIRGDLPIGVSHNRSRHNFLVQCCTKTNRIKKYSKDKNEAFLFYKNIKEKYIKEVADEYKDKIPQKLYEAMYNWKVEITD